MPRLRVLLPLVLASLPLFGACARPSVGTKATDSGVTERRPVRQPEGYVGSLVAPSPGTFYTKLREQVGSHIVLPLRFGTAAMMALGLPIALGSEVDETVPLTATAARRQSDPAYRVAVAIHVRSGERVLDQLVRGSDAHFSKRLDGATGITLLTREATATEPHLALAILDNFLLVGRSHEDLIDLGPFLLASPTKSSSSDVSVDLDPRALAGPIAGEVRDRLSAVGGLLGLVEPALVLLSDTEKATLDVSIERTGIVTRFALKPKPNGTGAALLSTLPVGDARPLLDLPNSMSLGLLWRETLPQRQADAPKLAKTVADLLGKSLPETDLAALESALALEAEARGDTQLLALHVDGAGITAVVHAPVVDEKKMREAVKQLVSFAKLASVRRALGERGLSATVGKTAVENLASDVTRVRIAQKKSDEVAKADGGEGPMDLLFFVSDKGLLAATGHDPKDALRTMAAALEGRIPPNERLLSPPQIGSFDETTLALVADMGRVAAVARGTPSPRNSPAPVVVALGRRSSGAELWGELDVPAASAALFLKSFADHREP